MSEAMDLRIDWLDAPGVTSPELAATWASYQLWVDGQCVTRVETEGGDVRRSVFGALYPLAEWIASNWWLLTSDVRPSGVSMNHWRWALSAKQPWLSGHNLRAAGDGMSWPDLSIVPEGAVTTLAWADDPWPTLGGLRFLGRGHASMPGRDVGTALAGIVDRVLDRLREKGVPSGNLGEEWAAVSASARDPEEADFCMTAARMGLDPYALDDETSALLVEVAESIPREIMDDFFSSIQANRLEQGKKWLEEALKGAMNAAGQARNDLSGLRADLGGIARDLDVGEAGSDGRRAWGVGYELAQAVRNSLGLEPVSIFDITPWVGLVETPGESAGIHGVCAVDQRRCGLTLPRSERIYGSRRLSGTTARFGSARALGMAVSQPREHRFLLSAIGTQRQRFSRSFAAELLAPAEGIARLLEDRDAVTEQDLNDVAEHFEVSPLVVQYQYENQLC